jgi:transcriptional/translational regulatory protein YebC/TACO1
VFSCGLESQSFLFNRIRTYLFDEVFLDEETNQINIYGEFTAFGGIQKFLEERGYELMGADFERIPDETKELIPKMDSILGYIDQIKQVEIKRN